jgi:hypothetical protein
VLECRLWRAEWAYQLMPDDPAAIEARAAFDIEARTIDEALDALPTHWGAANLD